MKPALLLLCHRIPYPPNKGDKIRSYHLLRYLSRRYRVYLGAFVDDPEDWQHEAHLGSLCEELKLVPLVPALARLRSLKGLLTGESLSVPYYADRRMHGWVKGVSTRVKPIGAVAFSSTMAQYVLPLARERHRVIVDFVDVDSDKWRQYAAARPWWSAWVYHREARRLERYEGRVARQVYASTFVSTQEAETFRSNVGSDALRIEGVPNGVDVDFFSPDRSRPNPFQERARTIVFTGAMDYWPNVDAVEWFVSEVLPRVMVADESAHFCIVGSSPTAAVGKLASPHVTVTGRVPDVRPYLQHASVVVAPMRIARGIQNKVLEGMAMAKAVVTTSLGFEGISAQADDELIIADTANSMASAVLKLLKEPTPANAIGAAARTRIQHDYQWDAVLEPFGRLLSDKTEG